MLNDTSHFTSQLSSENVILNVKCHISLNSRLLASPGAISRGPAGARPLARQPVDGSQAGQETGRAARLRAREYACG